MDEAIADAHALEWAARLSRWALGVFREGSRGPEDTEAGDEVQQHARRLEQMREAAWKRARAGGGA